MLKAVRHVGLSRSLYEAHRTEDAKFSPSGRLLVMVPKKAILIFSIDTSSRPIRINRYAELHSSSLAFPHGVDFLSEDIIVVANREGWVTFYRIPGVDEWEASMNIEPIHELESIWFGPKGATRMSGDRSVRCGPGAVRVHGNRLFIGTNYLNTVTVHPFQLHQGTIETGDGALMAQAGLELPDGLALTRDGRWMAVSDTGHNRVVVYRCADNAQSCELRDVNLGAPHGLCFDPTGRRLYVSDAGERFLHVFTSADGAWSSSAERSAFKLPAVEMEVLRKTKESVAEQFRPLVGGLKGIDLDPAGRVMATTCLHQTLRFLGAEPVQLEGSFAAGPFQTEEHDELHRIGACATENHGRMA
jgi:hypothetical protein